MLQPGFISVSITSRATLALLLLTAPVQAQQMATQPFMTLPALAQQAYTDTVSKFWFGISAAGHFDDVSDGAAVNYPASPIVFNFDMWWKYGTAANVAYSLWKTNASAAALATITTQWAFAKVRWTLTLAGTCGTGSGGWVQQDDATWAAAGFLEAYEATNDDVARQYAKAALDCAWTRWQDATMGGGLWYNDAKTQKNCYQAQYALTSYQYWQDTADITYHDRATQLEALAWNAIIRNGQAVTASGAGSPPDGTYTYPVDGLCWGSGVENNNAQTYGVAIAANRPNAIATASSVSLLEGNMAFAVLEARLYNETGSATNRARMNQIATGIRSLETVTGNILMNDRDAFTDGFAAWWYARDVLPLLTGAAGTQADKTTLLNTAWSAAINARCPQGSYGGDWQGPCQGLWHAIGSTQYDITVSSQAANLIIAGYYASLH